MDRQRQFLQAILDDPDDDVLRMVYADFLEEQGDPRAEFIRVQCELEKVENTPDWESPRRQQLTAWELDFIRKHKEEWFGPVRKQFSFWDCRRGFMDQVCCTEEVFLDVAEELFAAQPVRHVSLFCRHWRLAELSDCAYLARLATLRIWGPESERRSGVEAWRRFLSSPHLARLSELCLSRCDLDQRHVAALRSSFALADLKRLDLRYNRFLPKAQALLGGHFGDRVLLDNQIPGPRRRTRRTPPSD